MRLFSRNIHSRIISFSPDGLMLFSGQNNGAIQVWDTTSWRPLREAPGHSKALHPGHWLKTRNKYKCIAGFRFSPDGREYLTFSADQTWRRWDIRTDAPLAVGEVGESFTAIYSPDGGEVVTGTTSGKVQRWDAASGQRVGREEQRRRDGQPAGVDALLFLSDGNLMLASQDGHMDRWTREAAPPLPEVPLEF